MRKLVRKSYTPIVPIANTCSIGYPHDGRADNAAYRHDRRADSLSHLDYVPDFIEFHLLQTSDVVQTSG